MHVLTPIATHTGGAAKRIEKCVTQLPLRFGPRLPFDVGPRRCAFAATANCRLQVAVLGVHYGPADSVALIGSPRWGPCTTAHPRIFENRAAHEVRFVGNQSQGRASAHGMSPNSRPRQLQRAN